MASQHARSAFAWDMYMKMRAEIRAHDYDDTDPAQRKAKAERVQGLVDDWSEAFYAATDTAKKGRGRTEACDEVRKADAGTVHAQKKKCGEEQLTKSRKGRWDGIANGEEVTASIISKGFSTFLTPIYCFGWTAGTGGEEVARILATMPTRCIVVGPRTLHDSRCDPLSSSFV